METKLITTTDPHDERLKDVGEILRRGGLAAIPTETVYGLAANAFDEEAVRGIYRAKGRPSDNPLIVHISAFEQWEALVTEIPDRAKKLASLFWPGPLTMILPKSERIGPVVSGGLSTVAVRLPSHPIARAVIDFAGVPLAAPSANTSGRPSPTRASDVLEDLGGKIDAIVDAGPCSVGVESTVLSLCGEMPRLLRPGGVTAEMLRAALGKLEIDPAVYDQLQSGAVAASPGMKYKHYAPRAEVVLLKGSFEAFRAYVLSHADEHTLALCFTEEAALLPVKTVTFGSEKDSLSQAQRIFEALREVDRCGAKRVYARFPAMDGIGLAVFNRLVRAAAFHIIEL